MSDLEYRSAFGEIRGVNDTDKTFELRIVTYGVADSYGSVWEPGVFDESLRTKMPSAAWAHDWSRIIGSLKEYDLRDDGVDGLVKFADFDHVPDARMAWSLLRDGHIKDTSFGFKGEERRDTRADDGRLDGEKERISRARLDEVSPVLVGAVPGSRTLAVRSEGKISRMDAGQLLTAVAAGTVSLRDALNALEDGENLEITVPLAEELPEEREETEISEADAGLALMLMSIDEGNRAVGTAKNPGSTAQLKEYWAHGKGALKIRWGTAGDHTRCVHLLSKYVGPGVVHGLCTNIQQLAVGHAGNKTPAEKGL